MLTPTTLNLAFQNLGCNMRTSEKAWLGLGLGVLAYDVLSPKGETLSEGMDGMINKHPKLTYLAVGAVALHLLNIIPNQIDPLHQASRVFDRFKSDS